MATLKLIEQDESLPPPLTGEEVLREVAELIDRDLPQVRVDDPERVALEALRLACPGTRSPETRRRVR